MVRQIHRAYRWAYDAGWMAPANDRVRLPIANAAALLNHGRALIDASAPEQGTPSRLAAGLSFTPGFLASQATGQVFTLGFVPVSALVRGLLADVQGLRQS